MVLGAVRAVGGAEARKDRFEHAKERLTVGWGDIAEEPIVPGLREGSDPADQHLPLVRKRQRVHPAVLRDPFAHEDAARFEVGHQLGDSGFLQRDGTCEFVLRNAGVEPDYRENADRPRREIDFGADGLAFGAHEGLQGAPLARMLLQEVLRQLTARTARLEQVGEIEMTRWPEYGPLRAVFVAHPAAGKKREC